MEAVLLFRSYRGLVRSAPQSPLAPWVFDALAGSSPAGCVGLPDAVEAARVRGVATARIGELHRMAMLSTTAAEEDARARLTPVLQRVLAAS